MAVHDWGGKEGGGTEAKPGRRAVEEKGSLGIGMVSYWL